eukprot:3797209-Amphidinium_carterae.2
MCKSTHVWFLRTSVRLGVCPVHVCIEAHDVRLRQRRPLADNRVTFTLLLLPLQEQPQTLTRHAQ